MALSASSSVTHTASHKFTSSDSSRKPSLSYPQGLVPLPAKPAFEGSGLRRTKSRKPVKASTTHSNEVHSLESAITKVGEDIATTSGDILDAVDSVIEEGTTSRGRRSRTAGKMNSRLSRRRALVMCLALGMVRPCASTGESGGQESSGGDLRRTMSEFPIARSTSMQVGGSLLMSQVSLATSLKQTNVFGQKEDLQKLTTLQ